MSRCSSSLEFKVKHLNNENTDFEDEVDATCLGYFDDAKLPESAFDLTLKKLKQLIVFDFKNANKRDVSKWDVLKTVDEISLAAFHNDHCNFINISVNGAICRGLLNLGATLSLTGPGPAYRFADRL